MQIARIGLLRNGNMIKSLPYAIALAAFSFSFAAEKPNIGKSPGQVLQTTNVWNVRFQFSPDQWEAMEPEESGGGMFGGGPRGGGPGGRPPGGGFGPGMFLAPAFLQAADTDKNKSVTQAELNGLAAKWFADWDKKQKGALGEEEIKEGINGVVAPPGGGGPRMMNLQGAHGKRNGLASAVGIEFDYAKGNVEVDGKKFSNVAVRYKGNGTWMGSRFDKKRSMKVDLNEFVAGQKYAGLSKVNFHNCVTDASFMNEVLSYRLYRDAGVPAPRTAYARVTIDVPGKHSNEYFGIYSVVENVDANFADERFGTKKGAIFKPVTKEPFEDLGDNWAAYNQTYDPKNDLTEEQKKRVIAFSKLVTHANDEEFAAKLGEYLDLDNFSRYMAVTTWLATLDSILGIGQNYYVYLHPKTGKLNFIPWDLDHSFGQFFLMGSQEQREKLSIQKPWQGQVRFLERVFKTDAFQKLYRARFEEFSKTIFQPDRFVTQVDEIAAVIRNGVKDESPDKLERFDKVAAGEPVPPGGGFGPRPGPGGPPPGDGPRFGGFMQPSKPIKGFVKARAQSVNDQLSGKDQGVVLDTGFGPGGGRFAPGNFVAGGFKAKLDADTNGEVSREEFVGGFQKWFEAWDKEKTGSLNEDQLRAGLNETFMPPPGGPGGPAGPGPVVIPLGNRPRPEPKP